MRVWTEKEPDRLKILVEREDGSVHHVAIEATRVTNATVAVALVALAVNMEPEGR